MTNNRKEKNMIDDFYKNYCKATKYCTNPLNFYTHNPNSNSEPDVCFEIIINNNSEIVILEAKHSNKHNNHNYWKQLFGEILQNRKYYYICKTTNKVNKTPSFGIFLNYDNAQLPVIYTDYLVKNVTLDDWNNFGIQYNCKFVFLYDKNNHELYYSEWTDFIKYDSTKKNCPQIIKY